MGEFKWGKIVEKWNAGQDAWLEIHQFVHYVADSMAIGQISGPDLWGPKDDHMDLSSDLTWFKLWGDTVDIVEYADIGAATAAWKQKIVDTYDTYTSKQERWWSQCWDNADWFDWCRVTMQWEIDAYTRRAMQEGGAIAAGFLILAAKEADNSTFEYS